MGEEEEDFGGSSTCNTGRACLGMERYICGEGE